MLKKHHYAKMAIIIQKMNHHIMHLPIRPYGTFFKSFFKFEGSPRAITRTGNKIEVGSQRCS
jgi:hypothetical protein